MRRARGTAEAVHGRDQGCQGKGGGGKELNRGLGATSEEMVGGRRIGEDQGLELGERGEEDEDEDADEDADQENEEEEVTEQEKEEEEGGGGGGGGGREDVWWYAEGCRGGPRGTGGRGCRPSAASAPLAWSRGAGAGLNPLSSRREVPMNFATLNKKWFHEVNISVTIPSPTRDAHAQRRTHARTARRQRRRRRRIGRTCIYVYVRYACIRTRDTHAYKTAAYTLAHSLTLARSLSRNPLSFSRAGAALRAYITGATHAHVRARTHASASGRHTLSC